LTAVRQSENRQKHLTISCTGRLSRRWTCC